MNSGIYDFLLPYGNAGNLATHTPTWASGLGLEVDGRYWPGVDSDNISDPPAFSRNVNGATMSNRFRKGTTYNGGGEAPNENYIGSITAAMMKHMKDVLHISKFSEVNILGPASDLPGYNSNNLGMSSIATINVGYIGDFSTISSMDINAKGVTDIVGKDSTTPPAVITNSSKMGYLNIYGNVSRGTILNLFFVARIHGTGGQFIASDATNVGDSVTVNQVIFDHKYTVAPSGNAATYRPYYKAFLDSSAGNAPKITGIDFSAQYASSANNQTVHEMDEALWLVTARNDKTPNILASNLTALPAQHKWASETDFNNNAVAAISAQSGVMFAGGDAAREQEVRR
jgi:hypothetical protein